METIRADQPVLMPFALGPGQGDREDVLGVTHLYKARSGATGGLTVVEAEVPPGAGAPMHVHAHEDELIYVIAGEIVVEGHGIPGGRVTAGAGALCFAPRGFRHAYRNEADAPARVLVLVTPGAGIEAMFAALAALSPDGMAAAPAICAAAGVALAPPAA
jgi:quercetin dioxygenase-like cupin family protein